ncbi:MAG TPA: ATP-binding protein [Candidatus Dormibacteraeota bacterium]|nr:ATP-binding protein [Candidatus Dormibacteraeota bacterium]
MTARSAERWVTWTVALVGPIAVTAVLVRLRLSHQTQRDYVFIYLGVVAVVAVVRGLWPALSCAALSFLLVDWFFVPPVGTLTIADETDIVNLFAFLGTAVGIGLLGSLRRDALMQAQALAHQLREANSEMIRLNKEQAEAAASAVRLARSEQQVRTLQETDQLRRELLANVSHELRTPLGTILNESTDATDPSTPQEVEHKLQTIAAEARRLKLLVDDMLDMTVIESGSLVLDLQPLDLADAIAGAAERLHRVSPDREVTADGGHVEVLADWDRLGQVFDNLLSNADRFGPPETAINIRVSHEQPGLVTVRVSDHGPGIPPELREKVFQRFFRAGDGNGNSGTTGLGLAIVKGLVEAHAGTVVIEDGTDGGATFRFTLPEAPASS